MESGKVKIKVKWCGICGSDLYEYLGGLIFILVDKLYLLMNEIVFVIMGYEFFGEVVEVGEGVENYKIGDCVVVELIFVIYGYQGVYNFDE